MNDYDLVSGLIDAAFYYVVALLIGGILWLVGWQRRPRGGSRFLMGLGVVVVVIFGVASIQPISKALDNVNASSTSSNPTASSSTTLADTTTTTHCGFDPECLNDEGGFVRQPPPDPITPAEEVWCQASPENQIYVMLAAEILGLHDFDRAALTHVLEGRHTNTDRDLIVEQAADWPVGRMWDHSVKGPLEPSAWALACAAAHESVFGS